MAVQAVGSGEALVGDTGAVPAGHLWMCCEAAFPSKRRVLSHWATQQGCVVSVEKTEALISVLMVGCRTQPFLCTEATSSADQGRDFRISVLGVWSGRQ